MLCSLCGVAGASLRCPCHSVHYCNNECQKKHFPQHKERCTVWLLKKLQKVEDKARSISYPLIRDPEDELEREVRISDMIHMLDNLLKCYASYAFLKC